MSNVPSIFSKSVCTYNFFCAIFHQDSSVFGTTCMEYVQKHFWKEHLCALQVFLCVLVSRLVRAHSHSLEGTLDMSPTINWDVVALWLRRLLSTGGLWVRIPL